MNLTAVGQTLVNNIQKDITLVYLILMDSTRVDHTGVHHVRVDFTRMDLI